MFASRRFRRAPVLLAGLTLATSLFLAACGGSTSDDSVSDAAVLGFVTSSNINGLGNIGNGTNRWAGAAPTAISVYIPTAANSTETDLAAKARVAITDINQRLAGLVLLAEVSTPPATGGYLRVSYLTSFVPPGITDFQNYCANVATGPGVGNIVSASSPGGQRNNIVAWVNLGNGKCAVTQDIVTHEFGHALGLGSHFDGFGFGPSISRSFCDVLATLYANPVQTPAARLVVRRAAY